MSANEQHEGGCLCGAVRYRTTGTPKRASACSCTSCQRRTGSAFGISLYFDKGQVELSQGALKSYRFFSDAGSWIENQFCTTCGSTVTWTLELLPDHRGIAGGTFDQPTFWYHLERFLFARSKPSWLKVPDGIEVHQAMPRSIPVG